MDMAILQIFLHSKDIGSNQLGKNHGLSPLGAGRCCANELTAPAGRHKLS